VKLAVTLDVASGGYLVELITPGPWPLADDVYSETLIPFGEIENETAHERLRALVAMHFRFLGLR
jgi:hypothetical protein